MAHQEQDRYYLELALAEARAAAAAGTVPVGAVIVDPDGEILARGRNRIFTDQDGTAHAEIDAIRRTDTLLSRGALRGRCTLYTTLEPCPMCTGAILMNHLGRVVWITDDNYFGGFRTMRDAGLYGERFAGIAAERAPYPDLDRMVRSMMARFFAAQGLDSQVWWREEEEGPQAGRKGAFRMRRFIGSVILEGMDSLEPLAGWTPVAERVVPMPDDPDATVWHVRWYQVDEESLKERLPALAAATRPHWYVHFWEGDDLCVILAGKFFWAKVSDRSTWRAFIQYGDTVGVERKWTENIPTELPAWVKVGLAQPEG